MIAYGDDVVGTVAITNASWEMESAALGYQVDEAWQDRRIGLVACLPLSHSFSQRRHCGASQPW